MLKILLLVMVAGMVGLWIWCPGAKSKPDFPIACLDGSCSHGNKLSLPMYTKTETVKSGKFTYPGREIIIIVNSCDFIRENQ